MPATDNDRRGVIAGLTALGLGAAPWPAVAQVARPSVEGKTTWSESIMVVYLSDDLRTGFSYRICRFPDLGASWVWCHAIAEGRMYAYTDPLLPCGPVHMAPDSLTAGYDVPGARSRMTRVGPSAAMSRLAYSFDVGAFAGTEPHDGAGPVRITLDGDFRPEHSHAQLLPGRFERTGRIEATLTVAGRRYPLAGVGKQHEQTTTGPRFIVPFTYCDLWNGHASMLGLLTRRASSGDFQVGDATRAFRTFAVTPPGRERHLTAELADGSHLEGDATAAIQFGIPIFGRVWRGTFVSARVGGETMVGALNDWREDALPYAAA